MPISYNFNFYFQFNFNLHGPIKVRGGRGLDVISFLICILQEILAAPKSGGGWGLPPPSPLQAPLMLVNKQLGLFRIFPNYPIYIQKSVNIKGGYSSNTNDRMQDGGRLRRVCVLRTCNFISDNLLQTNVRRLLSQFDGLHVYA